MNNLYFACADCKIYVDAGYRWAHWTLEETGIVKRAAPIRVERVLAADDYWNPSGTESADWLRTDVLPSVRRFLNEHEPHRIVYGNMSDFLPADLCALLDWMQVGFMAQLLPRYFVEHLGLETWEQVREFVAGEISEPWWWMLEWEGLHDKVRQKFQELAERRGRHHPCASMPSG